MAAEAGYVSVEATGVETPADWADLKSPENYLGYQRAENFASGGPELNRRRVYAPAKSLALDEWTLAGEWTSAVK